MKRNIMIALALCLMMIATVGANAASAKQDENPRQAGKSSIYFYDVESTNDNGYGRLVINMEKKTPSYVLHADGLTPNTNYKFWHQGATAEDLYLLGSQVTTKSGRLSMHGTFTATSLKDLQKAQFWLTKAGLGSIESIKPRHKYIAAGESHSLVLTCDGEVYAWGNNNDCEVGPTDFSDWEDLEPPVPLLLEELRPDAVEVVGGQYHSLALMSDLTVYAWGDNTYGQLGVHSKDDSCIPLKVHGPGDVGYLTGITRLAAGAIHSLAVKEDGSLWSWGRNWYGQLGIHTKDDHTVPYQVHGPGDVGYLTDIVDVATGASANHSLALKSDGTVYAWGKGDHGQLGIHTKDDHTVPYQVHGPGDVGYLTGITRLAAGANFSLAVKSDGTVWAWGEGGHGQLGIHTKDDHTVPYQVHGPGDVGYLTDIVDVAAGQHHSLALKRDGTVYAWGGNGYGQLGIHTNDDHTVPYQVHGPNDEGYLTGIIEVAAGEYFSLAIREDGTVWAWGSNWLNQLGINQKGGSHTIPYQVHGPDNVGYLTGIGPTCIPLSEMLDQSQPVSQSPHTVGYDTLGAQIFTAGVSGELNRVSLRLQNYTSSPPTGAVLNISIQTVIGGLPSGEQIGTGTIPLSAIPALGSGGDWVDVDISGPIVHAGSQYALVLQTTIWDSQVTWWLAYQNEYGSSYTRGEMAFNYGSGWTTDESYDFTFKTYVILY